MFEITEKNQKTALQNMNEDLKIVTEKINYFQNIAKNSIFAIALILADIAEKPKEYFSGSNFNSIAEYGEEVFGYKKAYTYKLIKVAKFISIKDINGNELDVNYLIDETKRLELEKDDNKLIIEVLKDSDGFEFSPSQLLELIPLKDEQIKENLQELDSSLSCKELREKVKNIIKPAIETSATEVNTSATEEQIEEKTNEVKLTDKERIMQMLEITSSMENKEIKDKIILIFQKSLNALERIK